MIVGIDEAGRGSVIGPMVIGLAGVKNIEKLEEIEDLKDSKQLSPKKRKELFEKLNNLLDYKATIVVSAK